MALAHACFPGHCRCDMSGHIYRLRYIAPRAIQSRTHLAPCVKEGCSGGKNTHASCPHHGGKAFQKSTTLCMTYPEDACMLGWYLLVDSRPQFGRARSVHAFAFPSDEQPNHWVKPQDDGASRASAPQQCHRSRLPLLRSELRIEL